MTIYHGSECIIPSPKFGGGYEHNDYGRGFYTTTNKELAGEWAVLATGQDGYINEYTLNTADLNILKLDDLDIKHWIAILMQYRKGRFEEIAIERKNKFIQIFEINTSPYDIITGWRADDAFFSYIDAFLNVGLSLENLQKAMKFGDLGTQICIKSKIAFDKIKFVNSYPAIASKYYSSAKNRDTNARNAFRQMPDKTKGSLIFDFIGRE